MESQLFKILTTIGSLGLFLYGMKIMSESLQRIAGDKLRTILAAMTSTSLKRILVGLFITAVVQSSSATTVMIISFVNAGLINLTQSIGMIMGANIGTTATAWLISLLGFKIDFGMLSIPLIGIGFPFLFMKSSRLKSTGEFIIGFALLFLGLDLLKKAMSGLQQDPSVLEFLANFSDLGALSILLFVLIGTLLTVVIQSSSATMAITIIMCNNGWIPFDCAVAMVLGENIGTTITANLASLVANTDAKRAARAHLIFNVFGVMWMLMIFPLFIKLIVYAVDMMGGQDPVLYSDSRPIALALFHTMFNVFNTLILVGFTGLIAKIVTRMVKQKDDPKVRLTHIERGMLSTSQLSIVQANKELIAYGKRTSKMFGFVRSLFKETNMDKFDTTYNRIQKYENISDKVEVEIGNYLAKTAEEDIGGAAIKRVQMMLKVISDIEIMADCNYKIAKIIKYKRDNNIWFTQELRDNVNEMFDLIDRAIYIMNDNIESTDSNKAENIQKVYDIEKEINVLRTKLKVNYLLDIDSHDLKHNSIIIFSEIIAEAERLADAIEKISEHALNIPPHSQPDDED